MSLQSEELVHAFFGKKPAVESELTYDLMAGVVWMKIENLKKIVDLGIFQSDYLQRLIFCLL